MSARSYNLDKRRHGNITVERSEEQIEVLLHDNLIIRHNLKTEELYVSNCGWGTPTTRSAINRYFMLIGIVGMASQSKNTQYVSVYGNTINLDENNDEYSFFPNTIEVAATKTAKKLYKGKIVKETEETLTIRS